MELRKLNNGYYSLYDSDGDIVASNNPNTPCSRRLSKQNCDELFGVVDVEKLANKYISENDEHFDNYKEKGHSFVSFKDGFNKALELNKDKLFTVEDIANAINKAREGIVITRISEWETEKEFEYTESEIIQSLQQPTGIEVDIVTWVDLAATPTDSRHPDAYLGTDTGIPKLDENSCLILKSK